MKNYTFDLSVVSALLNRKRTFPLPIKDDLFGNNNRLIFTGRFAAIITAEGHILSCELNCMCCSNFIVTPIHKLYNEKRPIQGCGCMKGRAHITDVERFWSFVLKSHTCWIWTASLNTGGYGNFTVDGVTTTAHRYSWSISNGKIPDGLGVLHKCDVRKCVRPSHLFLGTPKDNMHDAMRKGKIISRKFDAIDLASIRKRYIAGESQCSITKDLNVNQSTIQRILSGITYKIQY